MKSYLGKDGQNPKLQMQIESELPLLINQQVSDKNDGDNI